MLTMQGGDSLVGGLPIIHITYQQYIANPSAYEDPDVIVHISGFPTAGNMPADYVGYDSNLNMEDIGNIATKAIAKVEPSDTALYLHNVGTGFINKDGNYCMTDVQIAVGGTIVLGTNCHVVDGGISSKLSNLLWTNESPSSSFSAQNITLSSSDYDMLELFFKYSSSNNNMLSSRFLKTFNTQLVFAIGNGATAQNYFRDVTYNSSTELGISAVQMNGGSTTEQNKIIPMYVYGIKL